MASVGGSDLSSSVMLLGRECYQGQRTEPLLVYAPLCVHVGASLIKRALLITAPPPKNNDNSDDSEEVNSVGYSNGWPRPSLLTLTAYPLLVLLPTHFSIYRLNPSSPHPPVSSLSPSQLDYSYVTFGFANWPWRTTLAIGGLVLAGTIHATSGWVILLRKKRKWGWKRWCGAMLALGIVGTGTLMIGTESVMVPKSLQRQMMEAYKVSWIYRY
ncbi:hypothetical protein FRC02_009982 [Tulasnella sp. 418]|nr:hypothetical protein FRC02_009982 [Tulasnella sp. 418]